MPHITVSRLRSPLALTSAALALACSPTDNTQPRPAVTAQGGSTGGVVAQGGSSPTGGTLATGGAIVTTGGVLATGGTTTGGTPMAGSAGQSAGAGTGGSTGGSASNTGGSSGGTSGGAGGGASGGGAAGAAKGGAAGSTSGSTNGGKAGSGSGGTSGAGAGSAGASGSAGATSCPGFVLCDTFEDGNLTANPNWLATANSFSVIDDGGSKVLKQQASTEAWAYSGVGTWTDVTIQARVKILDFMGTSSTNCGGIIARWQGSSSPNYMASLCAKGTVGIYKDGDLVDETNGTKTMTLAVNTWYALKFKVSGKPGSVSLTLTINDMPVISVTDPDTSTPVAAGYVALGSKKAISMEYDDIQVSSP